MNWTSAKEDIKTIQNLAQTLDQPSESEINSINLVDSCLKAYKKGFDKVVGFKDQSESEKQNLWEKFKSLFISKKGICKKLENNVKIHAAKLGEDISESENPIFIIKAKLYLNLLTECSQEWPDASNCARDYIQKEKEKMSLLFRD